MSPASQIMTNVLSHLPEACDMTRATNALHRVGEHVHLGPRLVLSSERVGQF